jgi:aminoacylase
MATCSFSSEAAIENFREYLRIKTVQPTPDYNGAVKFLQKMADQLQLSYKIFECKPNKPVFVMTWPGRKPSLPSVLLNSHMDVVPVFRELWKYDPFAADMDEDGNIYARGSQDMKCVGIQYIEAIRKLKSEGCCFDRTIHLSFVPDEEIGGADGMKLFVQTEDFRGLNIGFALDEGLASPSEEFMVYYSERLVWWLEVTCIGKPGHGSLFIENNAAEKLRRFINSALELRDHEEARLKSDSSLALGDVTTVNMTMIQGGVQQNVVPSELKATFDMRIPPTADVAKFELMIKNWCAEAGEDVTVSFISRKMKQRITSTSEDDPWWHALSTAFKTMNLQTKLAVFPASTDSYFLREVGCPAIGFSPMNHTPVLLHDHNEFLNSKVFLKGIDIYVNLIRNLSSVPAQ